MLHSTTNFLCCSSIQQYAHNNVLLNILSTLPTRFTYLGKVLYRKAMQSYVYM